MVEVLNPSCVLTQILDRDRWSSPSITPQNCHFEVVKFLVEKFVDGDAHGMFSHAIPVHQLTQI
jgi:hypothetical protein